MVGSPSELIALLNSPLGWLIAVCIVLYQLFAPWSKARTLLVETTDPIRDDISKVRTQVEDIDKDQEDLKDVTMALARAEPRVDDDMIQNALRDGNRGAERFLRDVATDGHGIDSDRYEDMRAFQDDAVDEQDSADAEQEADED